MLELEGWTFPSSQNHTSHYWKSVKKATKEFRFCIFFYLYSYIEKEMLDFWKNSFSTFNAVTRFGMPWIWIKNSWYTTSVSPLIQELIIFIIKNFIFFGLWNKLVLIIYSCMLIKRKWSFSLLFRVCVIVISRHISNVTVWILALRR